jgi:hypothetical protein
MEIGSLPGERLRGQRNVDSRMGDVLFDMGNASTAETGAVLEETIFCYQSLLPYYFRRVIVPLAYGESIDTLAEICILPSHLTSPSLHLHP